MAERGFSEATPAGARGAEAEALELHLRVQDPELVDELLAIASVREREAFALAALRIGVLSLRTARGQVDAQAVRGEVDRLLIELRKGLEGHRDTLQHGLEGALRDYFDPQSGRFEERVRALTHENGELATVIRRHVEGSDSALARTLGLHFGSESPLMRALDPSNADGLHRGIEKLVAEVVTAERERILAEFSLDQEGSALARLVKELREHRGELTREFSLDDEDSALSRLVRRVEKAQQQIADEFTLDSETSALARMRRELMEHAERQTERITSLEKRVGEELAALNARREVARRTPEHGREFEAEVLGWLERAARGSGDVVTDAGRSVGVIKGCKKGDVVIELGPEHHAAGARIVVEAKGDAGFTLARAREEIEMARRNRRAELGIFVWSRRAAPAGIKVFDRIGSDVFVVWDDEDETTDVYLDAGLATARALCVQARRDDDAELDFAELERAIRDVEKQTDGLEQILTHTNTIEGGVDRIRDRVRKMRNNLGRAVGNLDAFADAAKRRLG